MAISKQQYRSFDTPDLKDQKPPVQEVPDWWQSRKGVEKSIARGVYQGVLKLWMVQLAIGFLCWFLYLIVSTVR